MTIEVLRRTFAAAKHPAGSDKRARLNRDTLTSEFYASRRYMTREPFTMDDGTPHPSQHHLCRTFTTKAEADAYASNPLTKSGAGRPTMTDLLTFQASTETEFFNRIDP